jgi:alkaline phosphatase D
MKNYLFLIVFIVLSSCAHKQLPKGFLGGNIFEVHHDSAIFWARSENYKELRLELWKEQVLVKSYNIKRRERHDFTFELLLKELQPDSLYIYKVFHQKNEILMNEFFTPPHKKDVKRLKFAWSGDLAGQNVCRDSRSGFPIFKSIGKHDPDFFIGLGDMIYGDSLCLEKGHFGNEQVPGNYKKSSTIEDYWAHWRYTREDTLFSQFLLDVPYYGIWDDHDVVDDFGPHQKEGKKLISKGLQAYLDYNPLYDNELYRSIKWGENVQFFILDTRRYRDSNAQKDSRNKSMLGSKQWRWFKEEILYSKAKWKFIISSVPISVPTGSNVNVKGRDGWASIGTETGYEKELRKLFSFLARNQLNDTIWLTTDVHFAQVLEYRPFKRYPDFKITEFLVGPMSANFFPKKDLDPTFKPKRLFYYAPPENLRNFDEAKRFFNFGLGELNHRNELTLKIMDGHGRMVYQQEFK